MEKKITDFSVVELKSLAYDELTKIELCQNNLRLLNAEISKRLEFANQLNKDVVEESNDYMVKSQ
jgi:hypothetical protein